MEFSKRLSDVPFSHIFITKNDILRYFRPVEDVSQTWEPGDRGHIVEVGE